MIPSFWFSWLYNSRIEFTFFLTALKEVYAEQTEPPLFNFDEMNTTSLYFMFAILYSVFSVVAVEVVSSFLYNQLYNRGSLYGDRTFFKNVIRINVVFASVIIGLFGLINFAFSAFSSFSSTIISFLFYTIAHIVSFYVLKESAEINPRLVGTVFLFFFRMYFSILTIASVIAILRLDFKTIDFDAIATIVKLPVIILTAVAIYFLHLKKLFASQRYAQTVITVESNEKESPPNEIFKGFGF
jgi:hypothetical protein